MKLILDTKNKNKDSGKLKKAQKHAILTTNIFDLLNVDAMEIEDKLLSSKSQTWSKEKIKITHTLPPDD